MVPNSHLALSYNNSENTLMIMTLRSGSNVSIIYTAHSTKFINLIPTYISGVKVLHIYNAIIYKGSKVRGLK